MGTPRATQGSPRLGSRRGRTNSPRSGQVLSWHCPGARVPSQVSEGELDGPPERTGKGRGLSRMIGVPRPTNKRHEFCSRCSRSVWHAKRGRCPPPRRWPGLLATRTRRRTREQAGGVGAGARGLTQLGGAARMLSPALPRAGGEPAPGGGGRSAHAAAPTGAGSAAAASLSARALPEPGLACAAAPQRWR